MRKRRRRYRKPLATFKRAGLPRNIVGRTVLFALEYHTILVAVTAVEVDGTSRSTLRIILRIGSHVELTTCPVLGLCWRPNKGWWAIVPEDRGQSYRFPGHLEVVR